MVAQLEGPTREAHPFSRGTCKLVRVTSILMDEVYPPRTAKMKSDASVIHHFEGRKDRERAWLKDGCSSCAQDAVESGRKHILIASEAKFIQPGCNNLKLDGATGCIKVCCQG